MAIPEKGTPEYQLWLSAIDIAIHAPLRQGTNVGNAGIPWGDIHELRQALDGVGIDWRAAKAKSDRQRGHAAREA